MALTKIPRGLLDTGIADSSDATAITIDSSENVTTAGDVLVNKHLRLRTTDDQTNQWYLYTHTDDTFRINYNGAGNDEIVVNTSGKVGIGTTSPSFDLEVNKASAAAAVLINSGNNDAMLRLYTANNVGKWRVIATTSDDNLSIQNLNSGASAFNNRMTFTDAGNVGIADTTPAEKLSVTGAILSEGDHATGVNAMGAAAGILMHATGDTAYITATSNGNNHRYLSLRALNTGAANAGQITLSYTGDTTFTGASSTARLGSHSYGTTLETTTSDGSDNMGVGLDAGSGAGSTARGAGIWVYGNEASTNGGSIVAQLGASGDYKFYGGSGGDKVFHLNGAGAAGLEMTNSRFIVGNAYNTHTTYNQTSGNGQVGIYGKGAYSSCDAHIEVATSVDAGWAPIYLTKFNWSSGEDGRLIQFINYVGTSADYGTISYDGTNYAITNSSDYRLKENIVDYSGGLAKLEELKVRSFNKKDGPSKGIKQEGFIAHEASTANIPGFIIGEKDAMKTNETGETVPKYQEINKEALIPYLVSAIQELSAKVKELESK